MKHEAPNFLDIHRLAREARELADAGYHVAWCTDWKTVDQGERANAVARSSVALALAIRREAAKALRVEDGSP